MKLTPFLIIGIVFTTIIVASPLHQRTGRIGHVMHYHQDGTPGRLQKHMHLPDNSTNTQRGQFEPHTQLANENLNHMHGHSHGGHSHDTPSALPQRADSAHHGGHPQSRLYDVPSHEHFSTGKMGHATHSKTNSGSQGGADAGALNFDLSSLMIENDPFKGLSLSDLEQPTTGKPFATIPEKTLMPHQWKMKNTVQVSDTRSFNTIFREAMGARRPIRIKPSMSADLPGKGSDTVVATNRKVIKYEDSIDQINSSKSINKRGIGRFGSGLTQNTAGGGHESFYNKLTIRVWNNSKPGNNIRSNTRDMLERRTIFARTTRKLTPATTAPKFTRLGRIITKHTRPMSAFPTTSTPTRPHVTKRVDYTLQPKGTTPTPDMKVSDMVKLEGIHVMFADGTQRKNNKVPTLHLTAAVTDTESSTKQQTQRQNSGSKNETLLNDLLNKIVGTAVIKNGHLYLVVYPFGNSKSVDLRFRGDGSSKVDTAVPTTPKPNRQVLPTNKPVPFPGMKKEPTRLSTWKTDAPTKTTPTPSTVKPTSFPAFFTTKSFSSLDQAIQAHETSDAHNQIKSDRDPLARFGSPWKTMNMSSIFPHPTDKSSSDDDDKDVRVLPFVAKAIDPFDKIKMILAELANNTNNGTNAELGNPSIDPDTDASFNFELKIKGDIFTTTRDKKYETTTVNENTSDERTTEYSTRTSETTVTAEPKVTESEPVTENSKKYISRIRTNFVSSIEPTGSTLRPLSPTSTEFVMNPEHMPKSAATLNTDKDASTNIVGSSYINFGRIVDSGNGVSDTYVDQFLGPRVDARVATSSHMDSAFMHKTVHQLHAAENLLSNKTTFTKPSYRAPLVQRTTASPTEATVLPTISKEQPVVITTKSPRHPSQHVLPMVQGTKTHTKGALAGGSEGDTTSGAFKPVDNQRVRQDVVSPIVSAPMFDTPGYQQNNPAGKLAFPSHNLNRGQSEQIISLADVLNEIRNVQLHNMQRFNIQNNNYNTMLLSDADRAPSLRQPVFNNFPRIPSSPGSGFLNQPTTRPVTSNTHPWQHNRPIGRQTAMLDAMLVLAVDELVADHTSLHGALVLSQQRDTSSGSSSSNR